MKPSERIREICLRGDEAGVLPLAEAIARFLDEYDADVERRIKLEASREGARITYSMSNSGR